MALLKARQWVLLQRPRRRGSSAFLRRMGVKEGELEELQKSVKSVSCHQILHTYPLLGEQSPRGPHTGNTELRLHRVEVLAGLWVDVKTIRYGE